MSGPTFQGRVEKNGQPLHITQDSADGYYYFDVSGPRGSGRGDYNTFYLAGTPNGANAQLMATPDGTPGNGTLITDAILDAQGFVSFTVHSSGIIVSVQGVTTGTDFYLWII